MFRALRLRAFSASEFSSDVTAAMAPEMPLRGGGGAVGEVRCGQPAGWPARARRRVPRGLHDFAVRGGRHCAVIAVVCVWRPRHVAVGGYRGYTGSGRTRALTRHLSPPTRRTSTLGRDLRLINRRGRGVVEVGLVAGAVPERVRGGREVRRGGYGPWNEGGDVGNVEAGAGQVRVREFRVSLGRPRTSRSRCTLKCARTRVARTRGRCVAGPRTCAVGHCDCNARRRAPVRCRNGVWGWDARVLAETFTHVVEPTVFFLEDTDTDDRPNRGPRKSPAGKTRLKKKAGGSVQTNTNTRLTRPSRAPAVVIMACSENLPPLPDAVANLKDEGNGFFRAGDYLKAAGAYTKAIKVRLVSMFHRIWCDEIFAHLCPSLTVVDESRTNL